MTEAMKITLSTQPADARWGEKATWSINNDGITLHLTGNDDLGLIQRAAPLTSATKDLGKKPIASIKIPMIAKSDMHTGVRHLSGSARETIHITAMHAIPTAH